jgi:uncharacterized protein YhhL (DUF1145 family)
MLPKVIIAAIWILSLAAWFLPWTGLVASVLRWAGPLMAVAHVIEFVVFREVFEKSGGSTVSHFLNTFIFGVFHINPLRKALAASPADSEQ